MAINRDKIMKALRDRLKDRVPGLKYCERKMLTWEQAKEQPALCVMFAKDRAIVERGFPTRHVIVVTMMLYSQERPDTPETPQLALIDAIEKALERTPEESVKSNTSAGAFSTTLGGLVESCDIGEIEAYQGPDGSQAAAVIPVEILVLHSP